MKCQYRLLAVLSCFVLVVGIHKAQTPKDFAVQVTAMGTESPTASITLTWDAHANQQSITIQRKLIGESSFGTSYLAQLDSVATSYTDTSVVVGKSYEYRLVRDHVRMLKPDSAIHWWGFGYINTGIRVAPDLRNRVLVLVDSSMKGALASELEQYTTDLQAEGWSVTIRYVERAEQFNPQAVNAVRQLIREELIAGKRDIQAIFLVGRVATPYSGVIAPDGHTDHVGAWPADGIYGDDGGYYSDGTANRQNTTRPAQNNIPGDGKFDQSTFSSQLEVPVGRVDFFNLPAFGTSETELLKAYFAKAHLFRSGQLDVVRRGVIDDNFGSYGEGFATSAWRTFQLYGSDTSVKAADWFESLAGPQVYLWAYGCGGGTDVSCGGVCTTTELAAKPVNAIHTQLFGSYFGDWDTQNNLLRSAIATSPTALTCSWVGRPAWYTHRMALGGTIGASLLLSQNNSSNLNGQLGTFVPNLVLYSNGATLASIGERSVHIALIGDPTLRAIMEPVPPVLTALATIKQQNTIYVSWTDVQNADGYMVARSVNAGKFEFITSMPITAVSLTDTIVNDGTVRYQVYACGLRTTASGSYYDIGRPAEASVNTTDVTDPIGQPLSDALRVWPQPASSNASLHLVLPVGTLVVSVRIIDVSGATVWGADRIPTSAGTAQLELPASQLATGRYTIVVETATGVSTLPYLVVH